ncbi:uracil-xanthine permease family protein [Psychromonas sp. 14N.309.X.WAT.B.A12]|uniref:uracil-xanthine permease family protein n=1 Tax=unclassified Psychromonas TaxID=2614957 RepID=UPI0025B13608|nr:nucleobase:cation symporter-2 family protein [Psychromonas sp. 14N.309.X.WAT.B.A12]MDN2663459.1 nucleobase:cation symporter-2 family protein [Psychromonas sp. 14N.309.X.WAT.B.A12]
MSEESELIYKLDDNPSNKESFFAAIQHVLASFIGIITPTLIIGGVLGLGDEIPYLISMALMVSGVGTIIQAKRPMGIGAGMICVQGTSFAFLSSVLAAGFIAKANGGGPDQILSLIFGVCVLGAFVEIAVSQFLDKLKRVITPVVTGTVITVIGISLIKVGFTDLAGGQWLLTNKPELFASFDNLFLGGLVMASIIIAHKYGNQWVRLSSIIIGMIIGMIAAILMGKVNFSAINQVESIISLPVPFKYGFSFDIAAFIPIALIYLITAIETSGDITANCMVSKQPIAGKSYIKRIQQGILGDGVNSLIAGLFNTFPNTTFSQNNGVIQLTGIASRYIGVWIGGILIVMGLFPHIGALFRAVPNSVLGGATIIMFATVATAGVKILTHVELNRKNMLTLAVSFGMGLGVLLVPEVVNTVSANIGGDLGAIVKSIFGSPITASGLSVIVLTLFLGEYPEEYNPIIQDFPLDDEHSGKAKS